MRKVLVSNLVSVDGFFEGTNKELDWFVPSEEFFEYARLLLRSADALLFGRRTYQHMANYWPSAPADEIADSMNNLPKIVFSKSLQMVEWKNSRLVRNNIAGEVSTLKQQSGKDLVILGSAALACSLLQLGLIDEYRVILTPVLIGSGTPLFQNIRKKIKLKLSITHSFSSGFVVLYFQPEMR
jgi:dihydrofolate reductase